MSFPGKLLAVAQMYAVTANYFQSDESLHALPERPRHHVWRRKVCSASELQTALSCYRGWPIDEIIRCCTLAGSKDGCWPYGEDWERTCCQCFGSFLDGAYTYHNASMRILHLLETDLQYLNRAMNLLSAAFPKTTYQSSHVADWIRSEMISIFQPLRESLWFVLRAFHSLSNTHLQTEHKGMSHYVAELQMRLRVDLHIPDIIRDGSSSCLTNIFEKTCSKHHLPIFSHFPTTQGPALQGQILDFLGISTNFNAICGGKRLALTAPSRIFECALEEDVGRAPPRLWPIVDEEYLEWADVLTVGVDASRRGNGLRFAEVGSGPFGIWATRAAKAFLKFASADAPCHLLLVEPTDFGDRSLLRNHMTNNLPENRCRIEAVERYINNASDLREVLGEDGPSWDAVDIDAQGFELHMLRDNMQWLARRARRLHVSTHQRWIHFKILQWMKEADWTIVTHFPTWCVRGAENLGLGRFTNVDGHIIAIHPQHLFS